MQGAERTLNELEILDVLLVAVPFWGAVGMLAASAAMVITKFMYGGQPQAGVCFVGLVFSLLMVSAPYLVTTVGAVTADGAGRRIGLGEYVSGLPFAASVAVVLAVALWVIALLVALVGGAGFPRIDSDRR